MAARFATDPEHQRRVNQMQVEFDYTSPDAKRESLEEVYVPVMEDNMMSFPSISVNFLFIDSALNLDGSVSLAMSDTLNTDAIPDEGKDSDGA